MKYILHTLLLLIPFSSYCQNSFFDNLPSSDNSVFFNSGQDITLVVDKNETEVVKLSSDLLVKDIQSVFGISVQIVNNVKEVKSKNFILVGSLNDSESLKKYFRPFIKNLKNKWEHYTISTSKINNKNALIICGSDRRGTAFGILEISKQIGVSPWYWWADVPIKKKNLLYLKKSINYTDGPKVKYRGIFINDEAPALSSWSKEKFGGFNHLFYSNVFELMLRLKSNYIWPAMWGNAFYDDDPKNMKVAEKYAIVIGTSHHEPLMRAHDEWRRYGNKTKWNYETNPEKLKTFWKEGVERAKNEKIISVGMRGDGDEPMSEKTATELLERIVTDQRKIIEDVTKEPANQTPQLWALYKEVLDYYDKGMKVPDDITLLFCDDNWGNVRRLPAPNAPARSGGYGMYYHFDYVGGPRNYKWLNTNYLPRIWDQMMMCYQHNVKDIWIVNVGDIKPMEMPISFFIDLAWNPESFDYQKVLSYFDAWSEQQFGTEHAKEISNILLQSSKLLAIRKPEVLNSSSFSLEEFEQITQQLTKLETRSKKVMEQLGSEYESAFFQLIHHPITAVTNLYNMYHSQALNHHYYSKRNLKANGYARKVRDHYINDSIISLKYHTINDGKWNHMMSQTHIGYTYWQQPMRQIMPPTYRLANWEEDKNNRADTLFQNSENSQISLDLTTVKLSSNSNDIQWVTMPNYGKFSAALATLPFSHSRTPIDSAPEIEFNFDLIEEGYQYISLTHSPNLDIYGKGGLQYAISINGAEPITLKLNENDNNMLNWEHWVVESSINTVLKTDNLKKGKNNIIIKHMDPCIILQDVGILKNKNTIARFR
jgi:Glycosyl hydrolase family 115/Gylcosyl hydrolase family 115 C-terminal domain/Glycosyl hydrolase family 67 N-terminus